MEASSNSSSSDAPTISSSSEDAREWETIFEKSFEGYEGDEFAFFEEGYSTVNSKFGSNYLNLIDPEGYMRTPDIEGLSGEVKVELYCHVTNLNNLTAAAVGETFAFSLSTIAYSIDEDGFSVSDPVDTYSYSHTVTDEDVTNKASRLIPPISHPSRSWLISMPTGPTGFWSGWTTRSNSTVRGAIWPSGGSS